MSEENHYKLLHCAASCNQKEFCQTLINVHGLSVRTYDSAEGKETAVHTAAKFGHVPLLAYFLEEAGGDLNGSNDKLAQPWTPLHAATHASQVSSVNYLLRKKADVAPQSFSSTPLHIAAEHNHVDCIQAILESGSAGVVDLVRDRINR